jgi:hypothetical protein
VLTRLVREFYTHLEVVLDEDNGIVLQSTVEGHVLQIDLQVISRIISVLVLHISTSPFDEVVKAPYNAQENKRFNNDNIFIYILILIKQTHYFH